METKQILPQLFAKYLQYCVVMRNYAPATIAGYKSTFQVFSKDTSCLYPEQVTKAVVEQWFFHGRLNRKWGPVTFRSHHKDRMIPMNYKLFEILMEYLKDRERLKKDSIYFFTTLRDNTQIGVKCVDLLVRKLRKRTKVNFSAHTLRHGFARFYFRI